MIFVPVYGVVPTASAPESMNYSDSAGPTLLRRPITGYFESPLTLSQYVSAVNRRRWHHCSG